MAEKNYIGLRKININEKQGKHTLEIKLDFKPAIGVNIDPEKDRPTNEEYDFYDKVTFRTNVPDFEMESEIYLDLEKDKMKKILKIDHKCLDDPNHLVRLMAEIGGSVAGNYLEAGLINFYERPNNLDLRFKEIK